MNANAYCNGIYDDMYDLSMMMNVCKNEISVGAERETEN